ncbi:MAG: glycerophosphodiester phosphodiesterase [Alphaproteobacteria bacterium]|nr:glycerophosphodiester phosphodiesterase [Alphaproteobacteria bacterium]
MDLPRIIGHRGAAATAPENTLASFRTAAAMGVTMVEFDVMLTRDDRAVVFHDETLERTTDGHGRLREAPLATLIGLDAGGWFEPNFAGEPVPTLEAVLGLLQGLGIGANIEIKPTHPSDTRTAEIAIAVAAGLWPVDRPPPLLSSFSRRCLQVAEELAPTWPRGLIVDRLPSDWHEAAQALGLSTIHCLHRHLSPVVVAEIKRTGLGVVAWTVNELERAETLWGWGVEAVISDVPDVLQEG